MARHSLFAVPAIATSFALAACGGGTNAVNPGPGPVVVGPGALSISPASLSFSGPGAASKTFTVSSTIPNLPAPQLNLSGCAPVANIGTASTSLPATYTVTPTSNGNCTLVANLGSASATVGIQVGPNGSGTITATPTVALIVGGSPGTVTVRSTDGNATFSADPTACNGIASVSTTSNGGGAASYSVSPVAAGQCQFPIVSGSSSFVVAVSVGAQPTGPGAVQLSVSSMTFASRSAPPQTGTIGFTGTVGQVKVDEDDCIGLTGKPKIAYVTVGPSGSSQPLPAQFTVTLYGTASGTCVVHFVPQNGTGADLTVTVN